MATRKYSWLLLAFLGFIVLAGATGAQKSAVAAGSEPASIASLQVKFKVDPATTKSLYMGDVWASPAQFTGSQAGRMFGVEAKSVGRDSQGAEVDVEATWKSGNPNMVRISPGKGTQVKFTVVKPGQGTVMVSYAGLTKKLDLKATFADGVMQVEINQ